MLDVQLKKAKSTGVVRLICRTGHSVPCHIDAKSCVGFLSTPLVYTARSFHHFLYWFVVTEFEFMDHLLTVLNDSNLSEETAIDDAHKRCDDGLT